MSDFDTERAGRAPVAEAVTASRSLLARQSGSVWTNAGASGDVVFSLPTPEPGLRYNFIVVAGHAVTVRTDDEETISLGPLVGSPVSGEYATLSSSEVGSAVTVCGVSASDWFVTASVGDWTVGVAS